MVTGTCCCICYELRNKHTMCWGIVYGKIKRICLVLILMDCSGLLNKLSNRNVLYTKLVESQWPVCPLCEGLVNPKGLSVFYTTDGWIPRVYISAIRSCVNPSGLYVFYMKLGDPKGLSVRYTKLGESQGSDRYNIVLLPHRGMIQIMTTVNIHFQEYAFK